MLLRQKLKIIIFCYCTLCSSVLSLQCDKFLLSQVNKPQNELLYYPNSVFRDRKNRGERLSRRSPLFLVSNQLSVMKSSAILLVILLLYLYFS